MGGKHIKKQSTNSPAENKGGVVFITDELLIRHNTKG